LQEFKTAFGAQAQFPFRQATASSEPQLETLQSAVILQMTVSLCLMRHLQC
jgi:hypothetical protein